MGLGSERVAEPVLSSLTSCDQLHARAFPGSGRREARERWHGSLHATLPNERECGLARRSRTCARPSRCHGRRFRHHLRCRHQHGIPTCDQTRMAGAASRRGALPRNRNCDLRADQEPRAPRLRLEGDATLLPCGTRRCADRTAGGEPHGSPDSRPAPSWASGSASPSATPRALPTPTN